HFAEELFVVECFRDGQRLFVLCLRRLRIAEILMTESDEVDRARFEAAIVGCARERDDVIERVEALVEMIAGPLRPRKESSRALLTAGVVRVVRFFRRGDEAYARRVVLTALIERFASIDGQVERDCEGREHRYVPA